ncbi:hypothetical protein [Sulfuritalea sp.]|uniref:hypothetical protein n=1 Tax=Sulfuritalea sp. TaxID=2480090 RepID=UPI00286E59AD|nr:hypothetical protein [Sulfuritalea sp.]
MQLHQNTVRHGVGSERPARRHQAGERGNKGRQEEEKTLVEETRIWLCHRKYQYMLIFEKIKQRSQKFLANAPSLALRLASPEMHRTKPISTSTVAKFDQYHELVACQRELSRIKDFPPDVGHGPRSR